jgi:hypothetical protein
MRSVISLTEHLISTRSQLSQNRVYGLLLQSSPSFCGKGVVRTAKAGDIKVRRDRFVCLVLFAVHLLVVSSGTVRTRSARLGSANAEVIQRRQRDQTLCAPPSLERT